jgi:hypothetical protein
MFMAPDDGGAGETPPADPPAGDTPPAEGETPPADGDTPPADGDTPPKSLVSGDEEGGEGDDEGDAPKVEPITAEAITLPEGAVTDEAAMTGFLELMNDTEISPAERAQKLIDLQFSIAEDAAKASQALWEKTQADWQAEATALPEIGGDKLPETLANIKSGLDKLGATKATYAALDFTGAGNHPEIISILSKATAHLVEGQPPKDPAAPSKGNLSQADRIYSNSNME